MPQKTKRTPMMEQYFSVKDNYPDCLLFYRLGDFYELFYEDAYEASRVLEITLTSRNKNAEDPIPMCGVPHHAAKEYIRTLVEQGYKIAICEQLDDPKLTKGMVRRDVVQVITPGTYMDDSLKAQEKNNYLVALKKEGTHFYLAYVDISTGELKGTILSSKEELQTELSQLQSKELILETEELQGELQDLIDYFQLVVSIHLQEERHQELFSEDLTRTIHSQTLTATFQLLFDYLAVTQKRGLSHIQEAISYQPDHFLRMSHEAKRNLELIESLRSGKKYGSLFWFLDETKTAMGTRHLKRWIEKPLVQKEEIEQRQNQVESLIQHFFAREDIVSLLKTVYDLERIVGKVSFGSANARDLLQLKHSLEQIPKLISILEELQEPQIWGTILKDLQALPELRDTLEQSINEEAPISITEGDIIKNGYSKTLDTYREAMTNGKQWIVELQQKEREITGISSLKVSYNKVFGYYIEVTKANIAKLDENRYERKQTLANAERYVTPELKEKERIILEAEEKSSQLEYQLFVEIREEVKRYSASLQVLALAIATIDVLQSFSSISEQYRFVKPSLSMSDRHLEIIEGRHPVVEKVMGQSSYVPNSILMKPEDHMLLITGPNMSGKSTYMRQLALTVILAQIGCFVPATSARLPIFTKIFTRIGAADDLISGQSTFMVEMLETNMALQEADAYSLLLFDEIGRGTATYDGMALAQAIIEYIQQNIPAKTLFSTHYHELTQLSQDYSSIRNVHVGAMERNGEVVFLHKIMEGPADKSYGIHVAKLAGLPHSLLKNAQKVLEQLEQNQLQGKEESKQTAQLQLFDMEESSPQKESILEELVDLQLTNKTPLEVMMQVSQWQEKLRRDANGKN